MTAQPCPDEIPPKITECPRGCGYQVIAEPKGAEQFWRYGPWRLQIHLLAPKCYRPLFSYNPGRVLAAGPRRGAR